MVGVRWVRAIGLWSGCIRACNVLDQPWTSGSKTVFREIRGFCALVFWGLSEHAPVGSRGAANLTCV